MSFGFEWSTINLIYSTSDEARQSLKNSLSSWLHEEHKLKLTKDVKIGQLLQSFKLTQPCPALVKARSNLRLSEKNFIHLIELGLPEEYKGWDLQEVLRCMFLDGLALIASNLSNPVYIKALYQILFLIPGYSGNTRLIKELMKEGEVQEALASLDSSGKLLWKRIEIICSLGVSLYKISSCLKLCIDTNFQKNQLIRHRAIESSTDLTIKSLQVLKNEKTDLLYNTCNQLEENLRILKKFGYQKKLLQFLEGQTISTKNSLLAFSKVFTCKIKLFKHRLKTILQAIQFNQPNSVLKWSFSELTQIANLFINSLNECTAQNIISYNIFYQWLPKSILNNYTSLPKDLLMTSGGYNPKYTSLETTDWIYQQIYFNNEESIYNILKELSENVDLNNNLNTLFIIASAMQEIDSFYQKIQIESDHSINEKLNKENLSSEEFNFLNEEEYKLKFLSLSKINELSLELSKNNLFKNTFETVVELLQSYISFHKRILICATQMKDLMISYQEIYKIKLELINEPEKKEDISIFDFLEKEKNHSSYNYSKSKKIHKQKKAISNSNLNNYHNHNSGELKEKKAKQSYKENIKPVVNQAKRKNNACLSKQLISHRQSTYPNVDKSIFKDCARHLSLLELAQQALVLSHSSTSLTYAVVRSASLALEQTLKIITFESEEPFVATTHDHSILLQASNLSQPLFNSIIDTVQEVRLGNVFVRYPHHYQESIRNKNEAQPASLSWLLQSDALDGQALAEWINRVTLACQQVIGMQPHKMSEALKKPLPNKSLDKQQLKYLSELQSLAQTLHQSIDRLATQSREEQLIQKEMVFHLNGLIAVVKGFQTDVNSQLLWIYGEAALTHLQTLDEQLETFLHLKKEKVSLRLHDLKQWRDLLDQPETEDDKKVYTELNVDKGAHYVHQWLKRFHRTKVPEAVAWRLDAESLSQQPESEEGFTLVTNKKLHSFNDLTSRLFKLIEVTLKSASTRLT